jgi:hypothetical protein
MLVGGGLWGVYGMLLAILLVAALLCIMEMGYIHTQFFEKRLLSLARLLLPLMAAGIGVSFAEMQLLGRVDSYGLFAALGVLFVVVNGAVGLALSLVFNRRELLGLLGKVTRFLPKK